MSEGDDVNDELKLENENDDRADRIVAVLRTLWDGLKNEDDDAKLKTLYAGLSVAAGLGKKRSLQAFARFVEEQEGEPAYVSVLRHSTGYCHHYNQHSVFSVPLPEGMERPPPPVKH